MNLVLISRKLLVLFFGICALTLVAPPAMAACSEAKVKRLAKQGKTVAYIARTCDMKRDDVKDIIDADDSESDADSSGDTPPAGKGLPTGTPLAPCACYGGVSPQHREPNQACRSGYARPRACAQTCVGGGYAWQGVCG